MNFAFFKLFDSVFITFITVVMEVIDSRQVACKLYKGLSDALICTDDFITKVVQRYEQLFYSVAQVVASPRFVIMFPGN